ncbi:hypothetical protein V6N11_031152 [Hibiscus sabdariffa]|uniref:Uncharacterized protein n=1 Tax=Hibiscus sabdariffa TaxID=183260 RepID=A0ABR2N9X0_9ROSI
MILSLPFTTILSFHGSHPSPPPSVSSHHHAIVLSIGIFITVKCRYGLYLCPSPFRIVNGLRLRGEFFTYKPMISSKSIDDNTVVRAFQGQQLNVAQRVEGSKPSNIVDPTDSVPPLEGNIVPMQLQPPNRQFDTNITTNGSVQFKVSKLAVASSSHPPIIAAMQAAATSPYPPIMVSKINDVTSTHPPSTASNLAVATSTHPPLMASKLAAATSTLPPTMVPKTVAANFSHPSTMAIVDHVADAESSNKSTKTIGDNTNDTKDAISYAPMTLAHNSQSIGLNGSTLTPTTAPFDESNEFLDFLANPTEANGDIPSLYDNLGLESTAVTALPIPTEEELEKNMGKSFLGTPSMLIVFDNWIFKANSSSAVLHDKESAALTTRGAKSHSSIQNDNKLKWPRPPPNSSKTRARMRSIKNSPVEVEYQPRQGK